MWVLQVQGSVVVYCYCDMWFVFVFFVVVVGVDVEVLLVIVFVVVVQLCFGQCLDYFGWWWLVVEQVGGYGCQVVVVEVLGVVVYYWEYFVEYVVLGVYVVFEEVCQVWLGLIVCGKVVGQQVGCQVVVEQVVVQVFVLFQGVGQVVWGMVFVVVVEYFDYVLFVFLGFVVFFFWL